MNPVKTYYVHKPKDEGKKNFDWKKNLKIELFLAAPVAFFPFTPLYLQIYKFVSCPGRSQRGTSILKISKNLAINLFHGTLTETCNLTPFVL